jgi:hypothetical protein
LQAAQRLERRPETPFVVERQAQLPIVAKPIVSEAADDPLTILRKQTQSDESEPRLPRIFARLSSARRPVVGFAMLVLVVGFVGVLATGYVSNRSNASALPPVSTATGHAPTDVRIVSDTGSAVSLAWNDPYKGRVTYVVARLESASGPGAVQQAQRSNRALISGLNPDGKDCFAVGAVYAFGPQPAYAAPVCR